MPSTNETTTEEAWRLHPSGSNDETHTGYFYYPGFYKGGMYAQYRRLLALLEKNNGSLQPLSNTSGGGGGQPRPIGMADGGSGGTAGQPRSSGEQPRSPDLQPRSPEGRPRSSEGRPRSSGGRPRSSGGQPRAPSAAGGGDGGSGGSRPPRPPGGGGGGSRPLEPVGPRRPDPKPEPPADVDNGLDDIDPPEEVGDLKFVKLNLLAASNRLEHETVKYTDQSLIIRRGKPFKVKVTLNEAFNKDTDKVILKFLKGDKPEYSKRTLIQVSSADKEKFFLANGWTASVVKTTDTTVTLSVTSDPDAIIGRFSIIAETQRKKPDGKIQVTRKKIEEKMTILFNAFNETDDCFVADEKERTEYVMLDTGLVYAGSTSFPRNWNYGQFEENVLDTALYLLDEGYLQPHSHGNVVKVLRAMSAAVNSFQSYGVLVGNWSGDYSDGTSPSAWNGSVKIIQQYWKTKEAVQYGQCWVFAAVLTSLCRALGIPTRPITNFGSAHDQDGSCTIDKYYDMEGEPMKWRNRDSTWNFHVWCEAFIKRPDLPEGFDGWQAFDATPQELSEGIMQCGPCPVKAIIDGNIHIPYDGPFIFSEVNADTVYWQVTEDGDEKVIRIDSEKVGYDISTKAVGVAYRQDLTSQYKAREGSEAERRAAINAMRRDKKNWEKMVEAYEDHLKHIDVEFELQADMDEHENVHVKVHISNTSEEDRDMRGKIHLYASYNVGMSREELVTPFVKDLTLGPGQKETVSWEVDAVDYFSKLDDDASVLVEPTFYVPTGKQVWTRNSILQVQKPEIKVTVDKDKVEVGEEFTVTLTFTNPVKVKLTDVDVDLEGPGITKTKDVKVAKVLEPEASLTASVKLKAGRPGDNVIIASFDSRELQGISGVAHVTVAELPAEPDEEEED